MLISESIGTNKALKRRRLDNIAPLRSHFPLLEQIHRRLELLEQLNLITQLRITRVRTSVLPKHERCGLPAKLPPERMSWEGSRISSLERLHLCGTNSSVICTSTEITRTNAPLGGYTILIGFNPNKSLHEPAFLLNLLRNRRSSETSAGDEGGEKYFDVVATACACKFRLRFFFGGSVQKGQR